MGRSDPAFCVIGNNGPMVWALYSGILLTRHLASTSSVTGQIYVD